MKKSQNFFNHDYNAQGDQKMIPLRRDLSWAGYGIYWAVLERLSQAGGEMDADEKSIENLAFELRAEKEILKKVIFDFKLFEFNEAKFWSNRLIEHIQWMSEKSEKAKKSISKRWEGHTPKTTKKLEVKTASQDDLIKMLQEIEPGIFKFSGPPDQREHALKLLKIGEIILA